MRSQASGAPPHPARRARVRRPHPPHLDVAQRGGDAQGGVGLDVERERKGVYGGLRDVAAQQSRRAGGELKTRRARAGACRKRRGIAGCEVERHSGSRKPEKSCPEPGTGCGTRLLLRSPPATEAACRVPRRWRCIATLTAHARTPGSNETRAPATARGSRRPRSSAPPAACPGWR